MNWKSASHHRASVRQYPQALRRRPGLRLGRPPLPPQQPRLVRQSTSRRSLPTRHPLATQPSTSTPPSTQVRERRSFRLHRRQAATAPSPRDATCPFHLDDGKIDIDGWGFSGSRSPPAATGNVRQSPTIPCHARTRPAWKTTTSIDRSLGQVSIPRSPHQLRAPHGIIQIELN